MEFQVDPTTRVPIYRQLMDQIRLAVARGRLRAGSRLPSVRVLSRELVVNPNTIARVYTELERDGVLNTRPGLGVFVAEPQADFSAAARRQRLAEIVDGFLTDAVHLGFSADDVLSAVTKRIRGFQFVGSAADGGS
jgi:GntR family transcriptional regulator